MYNEVPGGGNSSLGKTGTRAIQHFRGRPIYKDFRLSYSFLRTLGGGPVEIPRNRVHFIVKVY